MKKLLTIVLSLFLALTPIGSLAACTPSGTGGGGASTKYTVTFDLGDYGAPISSQTVEKGKKATKPQDPDSGDEAIVFGGWYSDPALTIPFSFSSGINADVTVYAKWGQQVTVHYDMRGKSLGYIEDEVKFVGDYVEDPGEPEEEGYEFLGWVSSYRPAEAGEESDADAYGNIVVLFDFTQPLTGDTTIIAYWSPKIVVTHDVTFDINLSGLEQSVVDDFEANYGTVAVEDGQKIEKPAVNPSVDGYRFMGWYADAEGTTEFNFTKRVYEEKTVFAKWAEAQTVYFNFNANGHGSAPSRITVVTGEKATEPSTKPTAGGYTFAGWFQDQACSLPYDFDEPVEGETTVFAKWIENKTEGIITLNLGGYSVDGTQQASYKAMVKEFNEGYGQLNGIRVEVNLSGNWTDYANRDTQLTIGEGGFDIYMINDRYFKNWAKNFGTEKLYNIKDYTSQSTFDDQLSQMWQGMINRFRLNLNGWTSYEDDDLWEVPIDANPTALYYNRTVLESNGIIVISIEDKLITAENYDSLCDDYEGLKDVDFTEANGNTLLDLWNENLIADLFGSYHNDLIFIKGDSLVGYNKEQIGRDYLAEYTIPAKGFYRSDSPRFYDPDDQTTNEYAAPTYGEVLVFNASIATSWDEIEDVGMICTRKNGAKTYNAQSASNYGFFTQWWFSYGWSVGGDCIEDMTGDGAWAFSLCDFSANYLVKEEACTERNPDDDSDTKLYYIGQYSGKLYSAGQTLDFLDKVDVVPLTIEGTSATEGDIIVPLANGGYMAYDAKTGETRNLGTAPEGYTSSAAIRPSIIAAASVDRNDSEAKFVELPSTKEAFARFCHLYSNEADKASIGVAYATSSQASDGETADITKLGNGYVAFVIERGDKLGYLRTVAKDYSQSWGVANVPVFKEYLHPEDPDDDTVKRMGVQAGHSECVALGISTGCVEKRGPAVAQAAWEFIQWMAGDYFYIDAAGDTYFGQRKTSTDTRYRAGQAVKADTGYIPNQLSLFEATGLSDSTFIKPTEKYLNLQLFAYAIEYESAGDWWYLPNGNSTWINAWASDLNSASGVRGGSVTVAQWFTSGIIAATNVILNDTTLFNYYYGCDNIKAVWDLYVTR